MFWNGLKLNSMKASSKKFQFMILDKRKTIIININDIKIRESQNAELLGLTIDNWRDQRSHK